MQIGGRSLGQYRISHINNVFEDLLVDRIRIRGYGLEFLLRQALHLRIPGMGGKFDLRKGVNAIASQKTP